MAVASSSDEIDLLPLEEAKPANEEAFQPPASAGQPKAPMPGKTAKLAAPEELDVPEEVRNRPPPKNYDPPPESNLKLYIGGGIAAIFILFGAWRMFRTENKVILGRPQIDTTWTIQANTASVENYEISGKISWTLELTPLEDVLVVGVVKRNPKEPRSIAVLRKLPDPYETLRKGEPYSTSGQFQTGQYSLVVMNENKKPVKAKVKFKTQ